MKLILQNGNIIECSVQEYSELINKCLIPSSNSTLTFYDKEKQRITSVNGCVADNKASNSNEFFSENDDA